MDNKEGRIYRMFVPDTEIAETQTLLEGTDMEIGDFYRRAFELGKKAAKAQMEGKKVTIEEYGLEDSAVPQKEPEAWMAKWQNAESEFLAKPEASVDQNLAPNVHLLFGRKNKNER